MARTAVARVSGSVQGESGASLGFDFRSDFSAAIGDRRVQTLASGANTITPPVGTTAVIIVPPTTNAQTMILKGVTGDTGIRLKETKASYIAIDAAVSTTFVITAGAEITGVELIFL